VPSVVPAFQLFKDPIDAPLKTSPLGNI